MKGIAISIAAPDTVYEMGDISDFKKSNFWSDFIGHGDIMTLRAEIKKPGVPGILG
jgi:hypothetical protein